MTLKSQVDALLADHRPAHDRLQMDAFITRKSGGTLFGMYRQALRELDCRWTTLRKRYLERERLRSKIHALSNLLNGDGAPSDVEERIALIDLNLDLESLDRTIAESERETTHFLAQASSLKARLGHLTEERREALERDFWLFEFRSRIAVSLISTGRLPGAILEFLPSLPLDMRKALLEFVKEPSKAIDWYFELMTEELPALKPEEIDVEAIAYEDAMRTREPSRASVLDSVLRGDVDSLQV